MGHGIHATTTGPLGAGLPARDASVTSKPSGSALSAELSQVVASIDDEARVGSGKDTASGTAPSPRAAARYVGGAANLPIPFRTPASWALYRHYLPLVRAALWPDEARRAREEGRAMTFPFIASREANVCPLFRARNNRHRVVRRAAELRGEWRAELDPLTLAGDHVLTIRQPLIR